jgi:hypothetical protein
VMSVSSPRGISLGNFVATVERKAISVP